MADEVDGLVSDGSWERGFFLGLVGLFVWLLEGRGGFGAWAARYHGLFGFGWSGWVDRWTARCVLFLVLGLLFSVSPLDIAWCRLAGAGVGARSDLQWSGGAVERCLCSLVECVC